MHKNSSGFIQILLILVVIAVVVVFVIGKNKLGSVVTVGSPVPSATDDSTANWKTYSNSEFGYSLKYPSNLQIKELPSGIQLLDQKVIVSGIGVIKNVNSNYDNLESSKMFGENIWSYSNYNSEGGITSYYLVSKNYVFIFENIGLTNVDQILSTFKFTK